MRRQEIFTETIKDQIYQILKEEIVNCTIKSGDKLVEQTIADRLNVSRSPVREAIKQLTGDGLVENIPNKGAFVKKPTYKEIMDMYDVRLMFENYAARRACAGMKKSDEQQLKKFRENIQKALESGNRKSYAALERELSSFLISLGGNGVILSTYGNLYTMMANFSAAVLAGKPGRFAQSVEERLALIDALLARDPAAAEEHILRHLTQARDLIRSIIQHDSDPAV